MNKDYPLIDSDMIYDFKKHRYILTTEYVLNNLGIDLIEKMGGGRAVNAQASINALLDTRISQRLYALIYAHNDKRILEYILAKSESARQILLEAMSNQLLYILTESYSEDKWLSKDAYAILLQPIEETGRSVLYRVRYNLPRKVPTYAEGHY